MPTSKTTAVQKLRPSRLATGSQLEGLGGDVDLDDFHLQVRQGVGSDIVSAIIDATLERTITGASTLTVICDDDNDRTIQKSGVITKNVDVNVDGLWFTLVACSKQGRQLTLTFEEREVNLLRQYSSFIYASRSKVTRAEFILRMIREVKEEALQWVIPELHIQEAQSDISRGQILLGPDGSVLASQTQISDATTAAQERGKGIRTDSQLTVRGVKATPDQIKNADIILQTGEGMKATRKVLIASIMTAIDESNIENLNYGDRDSVGVFQQRPSQGWPASRNVAVDAAAFFKEAISANQGNPSLSIAMLCQTVQRSGTPDGSNYAPFQVEATAFLESYDRSPTTSEQAQLATASNTNAATNLFMRGQVTKARGMSGAYVLQPESSWKCGTRLANEVNFRFFCVSGVIYYISDQWLFKSKPFMQFSEDTPGIDWIDYDYDEGKKKSDVTITAHLSRWSAPPGSTIELVDMGHVNGKWLITDIKRSMYDNIGTITAEKPLPILPEPIQLSGVPSGFIGGKTTTSRNGAQAGSGADLRNANATQKTVVTYARAQLGVPYIYGGEIPGIGFDCSGLTAAAYNSAGIYLPHNAALQWQAGRQIPKGEILKPGDLLFFVTDGTPSAPGHVGIYVGGNNMIDAPHKGADVRIENFRVWTDYVGATRPYEKGR